VGLPLGSICVLALAVMLGLAGSALASGHEASTAGSAHETQSDGSAAPAGQGIDLGEYRIRTHYPVQAQKSIVRFVLYATALSDRTAETRDLIANRRHKVRDQVITATRMVPLSEFDEPELTSFRRRILLRLRRTMPELAIEGLYVSSFELKVQSL
jgi:hypothetical protein